MTLSFVESAKRLNPTVADLAGSLLPSLPTHHHIRHAFLSVSILAATVSPYLLNFYSSSTTTYAGMCFGGVVSMGVLVTSALTLAPHHLVVDSYDQAALMFVPVFIGGELCCSRLPLASAVLEPPSKSR